MLIMGGFALLQNLQKSALRRFLIATYEIKNTVNAEFAELCIKKIIYKGNRGFGEK